MTTALAAVTLLLSLAILAELVRGERGMVVLRPGAPASDPPPPSVSVVIAARDEEHGLEAALRSVLAQDHPALDVTVVDDRSEDATPRILARLADEHPRLRVIRVDALPAGWLGKNHALHRGAAEATGELILFTDADVVMEPSAVRVAAEHLHREGLDHLTLAPRILMPGWLLEVFVVVFGIFFSLYARPWRVGDPDDPAHVGIGAFNLIRTAAYRRLGGHEPIRMRPDDDLKLGKLVKKHRMRQGFAAAVDLLSVEWYPGVRAAVRGLRKNAFAGVGYSPALVVLATLVLLLFQVWPFVAVLVLSGVAFWLYVAVVLVLMAMYTGAALHQGRPAWRAVAFPLGCALFIVILWNSMLYTLRHRGIEWRGTHYPLDELRANRV